MTTQPLPVSTPAEQGVDAQGIGAFIDALEARADLAPRSLMMLRHGQVVAAGWWSPGSPARRQLVHSLSKIFTATAAGIAVAEGLLRLDDPVIAYFPELDRAITDPRSRSMLVRHVASMTSGHEFDTWDLVLARYPDEPVRGFLSMPPDQAPGTVFAYNQSATYTLAAIVQRVSNQTLTEYLRPRLFDPLGIGPVGWTQLPAGREIGFSGLYATTDAIARLGQLYLQGGVWRGQRLLTHDWVTEATRIHISTAGEPKPDWQLGYGFQFWTSRHGYRGDGAYGQFCLVLPQQDVVIAITAATLDMQFVLDAVWEHLLPAIGTAPAPSAGPDADLAGRLSTLALPAAPAAASAPVDREAWAGAMFAPAGGVISEQPSLVGVTVSVEGDEWWVRLSESGCDLRSTLKPGWTIREPDPSLRDSPGPTAVSGGWMDAQTLLVKVMFLETPHQLDVMCGLRSRTFAAHWVTTPLRAARLRDLRSPPTG